MDEKKPKNQIRIELNEEVGQGLYSNLVAITHSPSEFIIDFIRIMPGMPKAQVKSRIILTPEHAKRFLLAMKDNVTKFESVHGQIKDIQGTVPPNILMNFGGPTAQA